MAAHGDFSSKEAALVKSSVDKLSNKKEIDSMEKLRLLCFSHGAAGMVYLERAFRIMDDEGCKELNFDDFFECIYRNGFDCTEAEIRNMFDRFDVDGKGSINITNFMQKLREPQLPQSRFDTIQKAFDKVDGNTENVITLGHLLNNDCVNSDTMTDAQMLGDFAENFVGGLASTPGKVTKDEFINFYVAVSATFAIDDDFNAMMRQAYNL